MDNDDTNKSKQELMEDCCDFYQVYKKVVGPKAVSKSNWVLMANHEILGQAALALEGAPKMGEILTGPPMTDIPTVGIDDIADTVVPWAIPKLNI